MIINDQFIFAHPLNDLLGLHPVGAGVCLDQGDMPAVEDIRRRLGGPWRLRRGTPPGVPIREELFHLRPSSLDGRPYLPILISRGLWGCGRCAGGRRLEQVGDGPSAGVSGLWWVSGAPPQSDHERAEADHRGHSQASAVTHRRASSGTMWAEESRAWWGVRLLNDAQPTLPLPGSD